MRMYLTSLLAILFALLFSSCSSYKIVSTPKGDFIQSPDCKLRMTRAGSPKDNYQYIIFYNVTDRYELSVNNLNNAIAWSGNTDYFASDDKDHAQIADKIDVHKMKKAISRSTLPLSINAQAITTPAYKSATLDSNSIYFIQFDYNNLLSPGTSLEIDNNFKSLSRNLYQEISSNEDEHGFKWAVTLSQNLVGKIWEEIPIPQTSSLYRYYYNKNDNNSTIVLDPSFTLKVDQVRKVLNDNKNGYYYLKIGDYDVNFSRNEMGFSVQNKLVSRDGPSPRPNNHFADNTYLISSFSDIQNSEELKKRPYIVLFDPLIKRNSKPQSDTGLYNNLPGDDQTISIGNSVLLNLMATEFSTLDFSAITSPAKYINSVFGLRSPVKLEITVYINSEPFRVQLNSTIKDIQNRLPEKIQLYRKFGKGYEKVAGDLSNLILLPNDQIKFSL
ncbi:MAG TPA: hypothetical protein VK588_05105 [Chitinophagaceae bacterium]|nr:hypothetical protein [Chitinophagaceae bacterium]